MSRGCIDRFKFKHGIGMKVIGSEVAFSQTETVLEWRGKELQEILKEYKKEVIFKADESRLLQMSPQHDSISW